MSWAEISIGDIGRIVTGDTPPKKNPELYGDAYPFIKPTDMTVGQRVTTDYEDGYSQDGYEKYQKKLIPAGSTAVVTIGSIGQKLTWLHTDCFVNQAVNAVIPDAKRFNDLYVFYLLKHNLGLVKQADTGASSGRENVSKSNFSALKVWACLDIDQQTRIAEVLDGLDSLLEVNQKRIRLLEDAARRLYREWFVKLRFPGHESVRMVDGVPEGWNKAPLGSLIKTSSGGTPSRGRAEFYGEGFPWVKTKELNDGYILQTEEQITSEGLSNSSAKLFPEKTVLLAMYGATIGRTAILGMPAATNQACCAFLTADIPSLSEYVFIWLHEIKDILIGLGMGAAQPNLSQDIIHKIEFIMPGVHILNEFGMIVGDFFEQIRVLTNQSSNLAEARDALLPKLMSGQLAV